MNKIAIDITKAITPPSLFGIDRRIAYADRNYHSGWMCAGVTRGYAGVKLSGSLKMYSSFKVNTNSVVGTAVAQCLRCCATNRKVAGSYPDGVIGIFHWHNPSDRTMALGSTQPVTEMSTRRISWG